MVALFAAGVVFAHLRAQSPAPTAQTPSPTSQLTGVRYATGQNVAPVFEGWEKNPDGSFSFRFGYLNRNYEEEPEIPVGSNNSFSPGPADRGQPTHFYTRRQQFMFKVRVPPDFGKQKRAEARAAMIAACRDPRDAAVMMALHRV